MTASYHTMEYHENDDRAATDRNDGTAIEMWNANGTWDIRG